MQITITSLLTDNAFGEPFYVEGREAIADLVAKNHRCGIYVLHFADGMCYVGQTVDVTRRYVEHRRTYKDIVQLSFKQIAAEELDYEERRIRNILQDNRYILRGVIGVHPIPGEADFDLIMPVADQQKWLLDTQFFDYSGSRTHNPALRKTHENKFVRLAKKKIFNDTIEVLRRYIQVAIPRVRASEESFWSCSCLLSTHLLARINMNWQEVFAIFEDEGELCCHFQMALHPLDKFSLMRNYFEMTPPEIPIIVYHHEGDVYVHSFNPSNESVFLEWAESVGLEMDDETYDCFDDYLSRYDPCCIASHRYVPGGDDQIRFSIQGKNNILAFLEDTTMVAAIRQFNLRLMRLGPNRFKTSHCLALADLLVYEK